MGSARRRGGVAILAAQQACALAIGVAGCGKSPAERARIEALLEARRAKDALFATPEGPLAPEQRAVFRALRYYRPDLRFTCTGWLERDAVPDTVRFPTSQGGFDSYLRFGRIRFHLGGTPRTLTLYQALDGAHLFLPFSDETTGRTTYGAGRYLDVELAPGDSVLLDFNRAYNPYCAYNSRWSCPIAPAENHLPLAVAVGERNFGHAP
jgi:hypothetical protein